MRESYRIAEIKLTFTVDHPTWEKLTDKDLEDFSNVVDDFSDKIGSLTNDWIKEQKLPFKLRVED